MAQQNPPTPTTLPEVTEAHRLAAFQAMGWSGWSFEQAMGNDTRRRVIECRAHHLRKQQWTQANRAQRRTVQRPPEAVPIIARSRIWFDGKRAAAGDFQD